MEASSSNDSGFYPVHENFADGGEEGRTDGLTGIAGCLLASLVSLIMIAVVILAVKLSGL